MLGLGSALVAFHPYFNCVGNHGKLQQKMRSPKLQVPHTLLERFQCLSVPKHYFSHFHILSTLLGVFCIFSAKTWSSDQLSIILLTMHCMRRLWECLFCTAFGDSQMHIAGYLCGILHYLLCLSCVMVTSTPISLGDFEHSRFIIRIRMFGVMAFFLGNVYQSKCHLILYRSKLSQYARVGRANEIPTS